MQGPEVPKAPEVKKARNGGLGPLLNPATLVRLCYKDAYRPPKVACKINYNIRLGMHRISGPAGYPAGFLELSGIRYPAGFFSDPAG